jgi:hypothetical protein
VNVERGALSASWREEQTVKKCFRAAALLLIATMLVVSVPRPVAAKVDTSQALIIVGSIIGGLVVVALIGTLIVYRKPGLVNELLVKAPPPPPQVAERRIRFGPSCAPMPDGQMPMLCW